MSPKLKIRCGIVLILSCLGCGSLHGQSVGDSLVLYSDLTFHSDFEARSFQKFAQLRTDTFNLLMAIDENVTFEDALDAEKSYSEVLAELQREILGIKKINKQIREISSVFHDQYFRQYDENVYLPVLFETGRFNCASSSILYSLALDRINIPYKVMVSSNHVYLVANPGRRSVVIETPNPGPEYEIYTAGFKQMYVEFLRENNQINESEYESKSVEEIFKERYEQVKERTFTSLPGIQYYNKAYDKLQASEPEEAYELLKKAYYFYPDDRVINLLHYATLLVLEECDFQKETDMDYLVQYARFDYADPKYVNHKFGRIIQQNMQRVGKEEHCKKMHDRLVSQIPGSALRRELSFTFYLQMSYENLHTSKLGEYIAQAVKIRDDHVEANSMFESFIRQELSIHTDFRIALDSIHMLERRYGYDFMKPVFNELKSIALLRIAEDELDQDRPDACDRYLTRFEQTCQTPVENKSLKWTIEMVYRKIAVYHYYMDKPMARRVVERGLVFVPGSTIIKSAIY